MFAGLLYSERGGEKRKNPPFAFIDKEGKDGIIG